MNISKRILILSNNVLSLTSNNGKTIWSLFEDYHRDKLFQLFTRNELPSININSYFRITDKDVFKGKLFREYCGKCVDIVSSEEQNLAYKNKTSIIKRTSFSCLMRELLWAGGWKSKQLDIWLKKVNPDIIFFVAGDTLFSYAICRYIAKKTKASINVYVTDDYILKKNCENFFDILKRKLIYNRLKNILSRAKTFFTISEKMKCEYYNIFGKDSIPVFNISERLYRESEYIENNDNVVFVYAGSLYYGRDEILIKIARCLEKINSTIENKAKLQVFSNQEPSEKIINYLTIPGTSLYGGSLSRKLMVNKLNEADVLIFAESFDIEQIEKTRLSLSTKIPEYLSVGKLILAVGPKNIGSMEFLENVAVCVYNTDDLMNILQKIIDNKKMREDYEIKSIEKYNSLGDFRENRERFINELCDCKIHEKI